MGTFGSFLVWSKKDIFGFYAFLGKESRADWNKVFEDLINRGLKPVLAVILS
jgi:transposase-like protein